MGAQQPLSFQPETRRQLESIIKICSTPSDLSNRQIKEMISSLAENIHGIHSLIHFNSTVQPQPSKSLLRSRTMTYDNYSYNSNYRENQPTKIENIDNFQKTNNTQLKSSKQQIQTIKQQNQIKIKSLQLKSMQYAIKANKQISQIKSQIQNIKDQLRAVQKITNNQNWTERTIKFDTDNWIDPNCHFFKDIKNQIGEISTNKQNIHIFGKQILQGQSISFKIKIVSLKNSINIGIANKNLKHSTKFPNSQQNITYQNKGICWNGKQLNYLTKNTFKQNDQITVKINKSLGTIAWKKQNITLHSCYNDILKNFNIQWVIHIGMNKGDRISLVEIKYNS